MKKYFLAINILAGLLITSCSKTDHKDLWKAVIVPASPVSDSVPLSGTIKGTMLSGKTYTIGADVFINEGDTLTIQEGVTINITGKYGIGVKGSLLSIGTKAHPVRFTFPGLTKTDQYGADPNKDSAFVGKWIGIIGATTCPMMILKWTHLEFGGAAIPSTSAIKSIFANPYPVFFQN